MNILVTGGNGFVGSETMKLLKIWKHYMFNYDIMNGFDICDKKQFKNVCKDFMPDRILHLAAIARFGDADESPRRAFETNVIGTKNISEVCRKYHIPLIYASTGSVYMPILETPPITENFKAQGNSVYGSTKYMGELYVRDVNPHIILRYAHLYGKDKRMHGLIGGYLDRINRGLKPELYGGKQSNDFTYIKDVAEANFKALISPWDKWNQVYNIGTGEEITTEEAGEIICELAGWEKGVVTHKQRTVDPGRFVYDVSKAEIMLGFKAKYSFAKGLKDMFEEIGKE